MFSEKLGHAFDRPLGSLARRIPFSPNTITIAGFIVTFLASYVLLHDLRSGGLLVMAGGLFDLLDGAVARVNGKRTDFGAFLDSVLDRYSDSLIFLAIAVNLWNGGEIPGACLSVGTLVGALLVSYARARAEGLGTECKVGLMERAERLILICTGAITGFIVPVLWVLCILTHFTVLQRMFHVRKLMAGKR